MQKKDPYAAKFFWLNAKKKPLIVLVIAGFFLALVLIGVVMMTVQRSQNKALQTGEILQNQFGKGAQQVGVKTCAALFSMLGETLTTNSQFSAMTFWNQKNADGHAIQSIVGQLYGPADNPSKGAGVIFAAPVNSRCEGMLVRTVLAPHSCIDTVRNQLPDGAARQNDLAETAVFRLPDDGHVLMIPATPASCVVITMINLESM